MAQTMDTDMRMDIEVHASFELTARQQGQRRRRLREREHRLQRDDNNTDDGPTSLQTQHRTPPGLTERRGLSPQIRYSVQLIRNFVRFA